MDQDELTPPEPAYRTVMQLRGAVWAALLIIAALVAEALTPVPTGLLILPALAIAAWTTLIGPARAFRRMGYAFSADRLRVVKGYIFQTDTLVPLSRVQHIDVEAGPLLRRFGLAELQVHTAAADEATVTVPGLLRADAEAMREAIREHIRQATA
ncbi:MAG: PH domain-containing protein [Sphingomonadales bacterium]|nr:PH domain-containing protein [Sphingomonadaceae bacterium]MBS3931858.1 PH domain-containing protein [Sphingomonadales bacterium]